MCLGSEAHLTFRQFSSFPSLCFLLSLVLSSVHLCKFMDLGYVNSLSPLWSPLSLLTTLVSLGYVESLSNAFLPFYTLFLLLIFLAHLPLLVLTSNASADKSIGLHVCLWPRSLIATGDSAGCGFSLSLQIDPVTPVPSQRAPSVKLLGVCSLPAMLELLS